MTVSPVAPLPAPAGPTPDAPTNGADGGFATLVDHNLAAKPGPGGKHGKGGNPTGASLGGVPAGKSAAAGSHEHQDGSVADKPASDVATSLMTALAGAAMTGPTAAASPTAAAQPAKDTKATAKSGDAGPAGTEAATALAATTMPAGVAVAAPTATLPQTQQAAVTAAVAGPTAGTTGATSKQTDQKPGSLDLAGPAGAADPGGTSVPAPGTTNVATGGASTDTPGHQKGSAAGAPATPPAQGSPADLGLTIAPTAGAPAAAAPSGATASAAGAVHVPVTDQVFGEVSRLVSRGDGTQRITIKLQPEALGDVHVTLSMKNGDVSVSLAADRHAHHALLEGAPELHRLLESVGAKSSDIVVKNLPSFNPNRSDLLGQPGAQYGTGGREQSPDQTAGKQSGDTSARDGGTMRAVTAVQPSPIDPGTRARSTGVDVTM